MPVHAIASHRQYRTIGLDRSEDQCVAHKKSILDPVSFFNRYLTGLLLVPSSCRLLLKPGVKRYVMIPLLINVALFSIALWYGYSVINDLVTRANNWLPSWLDWLTSIIWPLFALAALIVVYYSFTLLANLISAPFNSLLSASIERHLTGKQDDQPLTLAGVTSIAGRTIWSEIRKLLYQLKWLIILVPLSFIPGLNIIAPFLWFYFAAWMLSINYVDYPMGNRDLYFADVKRHLKTDRATALGLGTGILILTMIPVLNFLAMSVGVATGTAYFARTHVED